MQVMALFTGSQFFGLQVTIPQCSLVSDSTYNSVPAPAKDVTLYWETFSEASEENGATYSAFPKFLTVQVRLSRVSTSFLHCHLATHIESIDMSSGYNL